MSWWDENPELLNLTAPTVAQTAGANPHADMTQTAQAPQAGQWAPTNQGFLDWATKTLGVSPGRGGGFVDIPDNQRQAILQRYTQETGNRADYQVGPSGDRVDFGQGTQDAFTSDGRIWNASAGGGGPHGGGNTGFNPAGGMPGGAGAPTGGGSLGGYGQPAPFSYPQSALGSFQGPAPYQAPAPFQGSSVPTPTMLGQPEKLSYQAYNGNPADNSYDFRFQQGQKATENALAHSGALRTGNAAKALTDYGQGAASTEYAAEDARRRANAGMNNANAFQFGQQNIANDFNATQANNANALQAQGQGYNQAANTYGLNNATQQGAQAQNFGQSLAGYQTNLGAQNQGYNQALGAAQLNANTALGFGNLGLGYQNSNNAYSLGQGNLALGQGQLGLQQQGQNFNQGFQTNQQNYQQQVLDPWNMNLQLAGLGNPGAPNGQANANAQSDLLTQQGNANASGQVGSANAWNGALGNLGLSTQQLAYLSSLRGGNSGYNQGQ